MIILSVKTQLVFIVTLTQQLAQDLLIHCAFPILMDAMEEINHSTHDEYGLKAKGILTAMEKFDTLFGLKLGYLLFGAAEE